MAIHIGRREFIRGAAAWLLAVRAQQSPSVENISRKLAKTGSPSFEKI
jgi:hypothetical protein